MAKRPDLTKDLFGDLFSSFSLDKVFKTTETTVTSETRSYRTVSDGAGLVLEVDLPGVDPKTVTLEAFPNQLVVKGKRGDKSFTQKFTLAPGYETRTARASMAHGQLKVKVAGSASPAPVMIPIEIK